MIRRLACAALTIGIIATAAPAWAQSLGEVARKEAARRATAKKAVKSFSNADLDPSEIAPPTPAAPAAVPGCIDSVTEGKCVPPEQVVANSQADGPAAEKNATAAAQKESDWRANADAIRAELAKARADYATLNAAATDPNKSPGERATTARTVALQQKIIEGAERKWLKLEQQAEDFRVPREWLGPRPILSTQNPQ